MEEIVHKLFDREVSYMSKELDREKSKFVEKPVKRIATFKELSRTDKSQHKLAMFITKTMRSFPRIPVLDEQGEQKKTEDGKFLFTTKIDDEALYDLTVRYVNDMIVRTEMFGEAEQKEMLCDSGGIYEFGMWLLVEKILPFFQILLEN